MRVALIEVGHWHAAMHLRSLQLAGAQIVGVSDRQPGVAAHFATPLGCPAFEDYHIMLRQTRPEFVLALGRHADMPQIARDLLATRLPFAIEKPIGLSAEQVAPLAEIARRQESFVAVPFVNRYSQLWASLDRLDNAGRAGLRSHAHFRIINGPPTRYENDNVAWMLDPAVSGGGCLRNLGIHAADAFLQFVGGEDVEVIGAAVTQRVHGKPVEEMGAAVLRSANGVIGTIEAGYSYASMTAGEFEWQAATANAYLIDRGPTLQVATLDDNIVQHTDNLPASARYDRFCVDTLQRLQAGQPPIAGIEDCYRAMRLIDEIYRKAVTTPYAAR
jgi:predicted dehydrogenase